MTYEPAEDKKPSLWPPHMLMVRPWMLSCWNRWLNYCLLNAFLDPQCYPNLISDHKLGRLTSITHVYRGTRLSPQVLKSQQRLQLWEKMVKIVLVRNHDASSLVNKWWWWKVNKGLCIWSGGEGVCQEVLLQRSNLDVCDGDGDASYGGDHDDAFISRRGGLLCQELFLQTSDARPVFFWTPFTAAKLMCTAYNRDEDDVQDYHTKNQFSIVN